MVTETRASTTQETHPAKTLIRTVFQMVVGFAAVLPAIVGATGVDDAAPWVAGALTISAAVTRIMALPAVEDFLRRFLPWLAADA